MPSTPAHASATTSTPSVPVPGSAVEIQLGLDGGRAGLAGESAPQHRVAEDRPEPVPVASVLILQPDEHVSSYDSHLLRCRGYEIVEAWHVDHAKAVTPRVELIICDIRPGPAGSHGRELMRWVREDHLLHWMPIIAITSSTGPSAVVAALDEGADDCVSDPFDSTELLARVAARG